MTVTLSGIETALGQALEAIPQVERVAWPNRTSDPARPFVMFQHVPTIWDDRTVTGGMTYAEGFVTVTVVIAQNQFTGPANTLADQIIAAFPKGRRISIGGGSVLVVTKPVAPALGLPDMADWRLPLRIDYQTETP
jgi:hypothetical protein